MGKKKFGPKFPPKPQTTEPWRSKIYARSLKAWERRVFEKSVRNYTCLAHTAQGLIGAPIIDPDAIRCCLAYECDTIEHQILTLRLMTCLRSKDYHQRRLFTASLLDCLYAHHRVVYEGILFGSSMNGLGFRDSDVDLRLRPLVQVGEDLFEPFNYDQEMVERTLKNIAWQTTRCCPAVGEFVPSLRCPIAKMTFLEGDPNNLQTLREGINYDISLSSTNSLGSFNTQYLRFLCHLEPKFHLLATILRYWSKVHDLIIAGYLSSYALITMLIFFCQTIDPPLLPTVDGMREIYLEHEGQKSQYGKDQALTQTEWNCLVSFNKDLYPQSANSEPLGLLLLRFFEFYLGFPYSSQIITTRTGKTLSHEEYERSPQFHPRFPIKDFLNVQDPFDLKHNVTSGMTGNHLHKFLLTVRHSYEKLFYELMYNFKRPPKLKLPQDESQDGTSEESPKGKGKASDDDPRDWGINVLFVPITVGKK